MVENLVRKSKISSDGESVIFWSEPEQKKVDCLNCKKSLNVPTKESEYVTQWRYECGACKEGCYQYEKDDTPGYRDSSAGECCKCKAKGST